MKKTYLIVIIIVVGIIRWVSIIKNAVQDNQQPIQIEGTWGVITEYTEWQLIDIKRGLQTQNQEMIDDLSLEETQKFLAWDESMLEFINKKINGVDKQIQEKRTEQGLNYLLAPKVSAGYIESIKEAKPSSDGYTITHKGFKDDDVVQDMIQYAWDVWGYNLVALIECENWWWNPKQQSNVVMNWIREQSYGLCQVHVHTASVPDDWKEQIDLCWKLRQWWTLFYWPTRIIKWKYCYAYVSDRFETIKN